MSNDTARPAHTERFPSPAILAAFLATVPSFALGQSAFDEDILKQASATDKKTMDIARGSFVGAPTPIQNPTIGGGLAMVGACRFKMDPGSEVCVLGISGFRTDNGSEGHPGGAKLTFHDQRWKLKGRMGYADLTCDLYVAG